MVQYIVDVLHSEEQSVCAVQGTGTAARAANVNVASEHVSHAYMPCQLLCLGQCLVNFGKHVVNM